MRNRPQTPRGAALVFATALALTGLAGCSGGTDEPEHSPTCDTLQTAVDNAQRDVEVAIAQISTDAAGTKSELDAVMAALAEARESVSDEEAELVARSQDAVARVVRQAKRAADGKEIDGLVVGEVRTELLEVVKDARAIC